MLVKELFNDNEDININTFLNKLGVDSKEYFSPNPSYLDNPLNYDNMDVATDLIINNLDKKFGILIDIDGDGYYSASLCYKSLNLFNPNCDIIPYFHSGKIHGLSDEIVLNKIIEDNIDILISPDASSGDLEQHKLLSERNIQVVSFDHHMTLKQSHNAIVVNNQMSDKVNNKQGSGTVVMFKAIQFMCKKLNFNFAKDLVDVVWFSLISDIMEMNTYENRLFAIWGKKNLQNKMLVALVNEYIYAKKKELNNITVSWNVQPKISSIIRSQNEEVKYALFMALATEQSEYIDIVMDNCNSIHNEQSKIVKEEFDNRVECVDNSNNIIFENGDGIYPFYRGLISSRFVSKFGKPTILYCKHDDIYSCSVRSNIPIKQELKDSGLFTFVEGHDSALGCGFKQDKLEDIKNFVKNVNIKVGKEVWLSCDRNNVPLNLFELTDKYSDIYGKGIQIPTIYIKPFRINGRDLQSLGNGTTLKLKQQDYDIMFFFMSKEKCEQLYVGKNKNYKIEIIGELGINEFRGKRTKQIIVQDYEISDDELSIDDIF